MPFKLFQNRQHNLMVTRPWRAVVAAAVVAGIACGASAFAANNSVQGAKKDDGGYDIDAPTAILVEAGSGSILFEKSPDELRPASSLMALMALDVVLRALTQGDSKTT